MGENDSFLPTFKACLKLYIDLKLFTPHLFFTIISQTLNEWMGSFKHHVFFFCFFSFLHRQYNHSPPVLYLCTLNVSQIISIEHTHAL